MMTCDEYVKAYKGKPVDEVPTVFWVHALDVVERIMAYKHDTIYPTRDYDNGLNEFRAGIEREKDNVEGDFEAFDNAFFKKVKKRPYLVEDDGDLEIDEYLSGNKKCFEDWQKVEIERKQATTVFINMSVAWGHRKRDDIPRARKEVYKIAALAEAEGQPCRVVGVVAGTRIPEKPGAVHIMFVVVKDYNDPIFPAIWAGLTSNEVCNSFANLIWTEFLGSTYGGIYLTPAGFSREELKELNMVNHCDPDEEVYVFGEYLTK